MDYFYAIVGNNPLVSMLLILGGLWLARKAAKVVMMWLS